MIGFPTCCAVAEQTADGTFVGRCWFHVKDGICPRHGNVSEVQSNFVSTGKLTAERDLKNKEEAMVEFIESVSHPIHGTALIAADGIFVTFCPERLEGLEWLRAWLWWFLCAGHKCHVVVRQRDGKKAKCRAVRVAKTYVRMSNNA